MNFLRQAMTARDRRADIDRQQ